MKMKLATIDAGGEKKRTHEMALKCEAGPGDGRITKPSAVAECLP